VDAVPAPTAMPAHSRAPSVFIFSMGEQRTSATISRADAIALLVLCSIQLELQLLAQAHRRRESLLLELREVETKQQVNVAMPIRLLTALIAIRYFAAAELVMMATLRLVTTFQGHGTSFVGWLSLAGLIAMPIIYYMSGRQLHKRRKALQQHPSSEHPLLRSDYIYLAIPIGISVGAAFMLTLIGTYPYQ